MWLLLPKESSNSKQLEHGSFTNMVKYKSDYEDLHRLIFKKRYMGELSLCKSSYSVGQPELNPALAHVIQLSSLAGILKAISVQARAQDWIKSY